eukprot:jgi/Astpho2/5980/fgenesh1_pg.00084_%23_3_t
MAALVLLLVLVLLVVVQCCLFVRWLLGPWLLLLLACQTAAELVRKAEQLKQAAEQQVQDAKHNVVSSDRAVQQAQERLGLLQARSLEVQGARLTADEELETLQAFARYFAERSKEKQQDVDKLHAEVGEVEEDISNQHKEIDEAETAADVARELVEAEEQKLQAAEQQLQGAHARQQRANQAVTEPLTGSLPMESSIAAAAAVAAKQITEGVAANGLVKTESGRSPVSERAKPREKRKRSRSPTPPRKGSRRSRSRRRDSPRRDTSRRGSSRDRRDLSRRDSSRDRRSGGGRRSLDWHKSRSPERRRARSPDRRRRVSPETRRRPRDHVRAAAAGSKLKGSDKSPRDLPLLDKPAKEVRPEAKEANLEARGAKPEVKVVAKSEAKPGSKPGAAAAAIPRLSMAADELLDEAEALPAPLSPRQKGSSQKRTTLPSSPDRLVGEPNSTSKAEAGSPVGKRRRSSGGKQEHSPVAGRKRCRSSSPDRDGLRARSGDRSPKKKPAGRHPSDLKIDENTLDLFSWALKSNLRQRRPPFCISLINTTMKREDPRWDVQAAFACTFYVLCQRFELDGLLKLAKRGSEVDVVASRLEDDIHSSSRRLASLSPPRSGPPSPGGRWNPSGAGERWEMK